MKCKYPYTGNNCSITYLDYLKENGNYNSYLYVQYFYLIGSSITLLLSSYLFYMSYKKRESYLQKVTYLSCLCVSVLFTIRGIDPESYGDIIPKIINQLCWDISTSLLYTVLYTYLFYMIKSLDKYNKNLLFIKLTINIMTFITWILCILSSFLQTYLDNRKIFRSLKLICLSVILVLLTSLINRYNYKIYKVINVIECNKNEGSKRISNKIIFISILLNVLSLLTVTFQLYSSYLIFKNNNLSRLPTEGFRFPMFGLLQYLVIVFLLLTYKKKYIGNKISNFFKCYGEKKISEIELSNISIKETSINI